MKKSIVAIAVAHALAARTINIDVSPCWSIETRHSLPMTPEAAHIRNGDEPWKTKNKRGRR